MTSARAATRGSRLVVALLTLAVIVGCQESTPSASPPGSTTPASPPTGASPGASLPGSSAEVAAALAGLGISVFDDSGAPITAPSAPDVPIAMAARQADLLAMAAHEGVGFLGADLDGLVPPAAGGRTLSAGLVELIRTGGGPGAAYARTLIPGLDGADPAIVVFPALAIVAVQSDLLRELGMTAEAARAGGAQLVAWNLLAPKSECDRFLSVSQPWVDALVQKVITGYLASTPDATIVASEGTTLLIGPDIGAADIGQVRQRLVTVYLIAYLATLYPPWVPRLTADPAETRKAIGDEPPIAGEITVSVVDPVTPERLELVECAKRNGVQGAGALGLTSYFGHPVVWTLEQAPAGLAVNDTALAMDPDLASSPDRTASPEFGRVYAETHLDDSGRLTLRYHTMSEPDADGPERTGTLTVHVKVERPEWQALLDELNGEWLRTFYPALENAVQDRIRLDGIRSNLEHAVATIDSILTTSRATIAVPVTYHESDLLSAPDPCTLVTKAEVEAHAGLAVWPPKQGPEDFPGDRTGRACIFGSTEVPEDNPMQIGVKIGVVDLGPDAESLFAEYRALSLAQVPGAVSIEGLGDDNVVITPGGGVSSVTVRRKNIVIVVGVVSGGLDAATALARLALTRF